MASTEDENIPTVRGQPDSWTLVREGFEQPSFTLQKHMPEITVGRSHECLLACPGNNMYPLGPGQTVLY